MTKKKKIFFIIDKLAPGKGGASTHLLSLLPGLCDEYAIYVCGLGGANKGPVIDELKSMGVPVYCLGVDGINNLKAIGKFFKLVELLKVIKPDIVHTYLFSSNIFGIAAAFLTGVPIRVSSRREVGTWKGVLHIIAERLISHLCQTILVPSNAIKEYAVVQENVRENKFTVIHNGIKKDRFNEPHGMDEIKKELGIKKSDVIIGTVGNLIPVKDHNTLFNVAVKITNEFPNTKFVIVGGGRFLEEFRKKNERRQQRKSNQIFRIPMGC